MMKEIFLIFIFDQGRLNERSLLSAREKQLLSGHTGNITEVLNGLFGVCKLKIKSFSNFVAAIYFLVIVLFFFKFCVFSKTLLILGIINLNPFQRKKVFPFSFVPLQFFIYSYVHWHLVNSATELHP